MRCKFAILLIALSIMLAPCAIAGTPRLNIPWKPVYSDTDQDFTNSDRREEIELKFAYELAQISDNEVDIPQTQDKLAVFYCRNNRFCEAEHMFVKAIDSLKICRGDHDIKVATEYQRLGALAASERDYKSSFQIISRTVSGDNILSALTANNLAEVIAGQGKIKEAEHWFRKTIAILKASGSDATTIQVVVNDYLDMLENEHKKHGVMQAYPLKLLQ